MELEVNATQLTETTVLTIVGKDVHTTVSHHANGHMELDIYDMTAEDMVKLANAITKASLEIESEELPLDGQMPFENCEHWDFSKDWDFPKDWCPLIEKDCLRKMGHECHDYRPVCRVCSKPLENPDHEVCCDKCSEAAGL